MGYKMLIGVEGNDGKYGLGRFWGVGGIDGY